MSYIRSTVREHGLDVQTPSDEEIVAAARVNPEAFAPLYERYVQPVYRYCYTRLGTSADAEDATSEVFFKALARLSSYRGGSFRAWLFAIAHNVAIDAVRHRRPQATLETTGELADSRPTPEEEIVAITSEFVLLDVLPEEQRRVVELRLAGLTGKEIAEGLGRSLASIKGLQFRAMTQLRAVLADVTQEDKPNDRH